MKTYWRTVSVVVCSHCTIDGRAIGVESISMYLKFIAEKDLDPKKFQVGAQWDYPLNLTEWNKDPYPNGVQDLPPEIKKELREGGKARIVTDAKTRLPFCWKSSQDLT